MQTSHRTVGSAAAPPENPGRADVDVVAAAVDALSWLDREALVLRFRDRRSLAEIALITGTTTAMVRVRVHRAATRVEQTVGFVPVDGTRPTADNRDPDVVLEDAALGVTPVLAGRLDAALRRRPVGRDAPRWRWLQEAHEGALAHASGLSVIGALTGGVAAVALLLTAA